MSIYLYIYIYIYILKHFDIKVGTLELNSIVIAKRAIACLLLFDVLAGSLAHYLFYATAGYLP